MSSSAYTAYCQTCDIGVGNADPRMVDLWATGHEAGFGHTVELGDGE